MAFEVGKIYQLSKEWQEYFDKLSRIFGRYHYALCTSADSGDIGTVNIVAKDTTEAYMEGIPFKFSDVRLCSLSSKSELKIFRLLRTDCDSRYDTEQAIVIARDEETARDMDIEDWTNDLSQIQVTYLGDYQGELKHGHILMSQKYDGY